MQTLFLLAFLIFFTSVFQQTVDSVLASRLTATSRIVNGKEADITQFPYQLSLRRKSKHHCGASVLSSYWSITAAHCVNGFEKSPYLFTLRGGSSMRLSGGTIIHVVEIFIHPLYNSKTDNFDVSLLRTLPIRLRGNFIRPIKLPNVNVYLPDNSAAIVTGWGQLNSSETDLSKVLKNTTVYIYNHKECVESLKSHGTVTKAMFCAAAMNTDACQGDSGGPLQVNDTLFGVVSWGVGCAIPKYPGVYACLSYPDIRLWIKMFTHL